jgi:hypothetical protein
MRPLAILAAALLTGCIVNVDPGPDRIDTMIATARAQGSLPVILHPMGADGELNGNAEPLLAFLAALHVDQVRYDPAIGLVYTTVTAHQLSSIDAAQLCSSINQDYE